MPKLAETIAIAVTVAVIATLITHWVEDRLEGGSGCGCRST